MDYASGDSEVESLNGKLHDERLNGEIFYTVKEAKVLIESWRRHYSTVWPHSSGYRPPAPKAMGMSSTHIDSDLCTGGGKVRASASVSNQWTFRHSVLARALWLNWDHASN